MSKYNSPWNTTTEDELRGFWNQGLSIDEIASRMEFSRKQIIAKAARLSDLPNRPILHEPAGGGPARNPHYAPAKSDEFDWKVMLRLANMKHTERLQELGLRYDDVPTNDVFPRLPFISVNVG